LENSGNWENFKQGKLWKLKIFSEGALSLNMIFDQFFLSEGAELNKGKVSWCSLCIAVNREALCNNS